MSTAVSYQLHSHVKMRLSHNDRFSACRLQLRALLDFADLQLLAVLVQHFLAVVLPELL